MKFLLEKAEPLLDLRIRNLLQEAAGGNSELKTAAVKRISAWLAKFKDPVGKEVRIEELTRKWNISRSLLGLGMGSAGNRKESFSRPAVAIAPKQVKQVKMTAAEKVILQGLILGGAHAQVVYETMEKLPAENEKMDLFEYPPLREFVSKWLKDPSLSSRIREVPDVFFGPDSDPQIGSIISETLMVTQTLDPIYDNRLPPLEAVRVSCNRRVFKLWARISQSIKGRLGDAEAQKNENLQSQLMQEYLDVQRKMKELSHFYDEGE